MLTKRSHEGYLQIDHRESPGVSDVAIAIAAPGMPPGAGRGLFEAPTFTCSHCQSVVVINPLRTRDRAHCRKCDHLLCDSCGAGLFATGECLSFKQRIDDVLELASRDQDFSHLLIT